MKQRIGIDLGGTKIEGVVLDADGSEIGRKRLPTEQHKGYQHILKVVTRVYNEMRMLIREAPHTLGIGTPGAISPRNGSLRNSNTVCLNGKNLKEDLENILTHPLAMQNDANCFALAEALFGAGRGHRIVFGIIMGTGCGGGIVIDGKVHAGRTAIAGEWGHMTIDPQGPTCYCGKQGCVETMISGGGLESLYAEMYNKNITLPEIIAAYYRKEREAIKFINHFFTNFSLALANLINVLDPDIVVIGGGVSNFSELYTRGSEEVRKIVFSDYLDTPIIQHQLGDSAGVIGAAMIGV